VVADVVNLRRKGEQREEGEVIRDSPDEGSSSPR
jgi:hypothetical protein